jgi:Tol biopolymer transport system component
MRSSIAVFLAAMLACMARSNAAAPASWDASFPAPDDTPKVLAPDVLCTGDDESHASVFPDGRTLYFLKNTPSFDFYTIVYSELRDGKWSRPRTAPFSGRYADADIVFTADGRRAYFVSARPVNGQPREDMEIWTVERDARGNWGEPRHVDELSSPTDEWFPNLTADGTIYFGSDRPGGVGGTDIWRARFVNGKFQPPQNVGAPVNSKGDEIEPFISADEQTLIVAARNRGDAVGAYDLYVAHRRGETWDTPRHPGPPINSTGWDFAPRLSPDGKIFIFTSNRGFGSQGPDRTLDFDQLERRLRSPGNGLRDIYYVSADALLR